MARMKKTSMDLGVEVAGVKLCNPLMLASGILGTEAELLARVAREEIGVVTTKSCCLEERKGHENPTVLAWEGGVINAVGLTNPGVKVEVKEIGELKRLLAGRKTKIMASFFGCSVREFVAVAKRLETAKPDLLEMNISCPNTESDLGRAFAVDAGDTYEVVRAVTSAVKLPVVVKLSPNVTDIGEIARAAEKGGASAISAINTLTGMVIDVSARRPILTNKMGGVSGRAIRPVAVRCVYQIYEAVSIPVIGVGGISNGRDVVEMMMAGAMAVELGSVVYERGIEAFSEISGEIREWMGTEKVSKLEEIRGVAHED